MPSPAELNATVLSFLISTPAAFIASAKARCPELPSEVPIETLNDGRVFLQAVNEFAAGLERRIGPHGDAFILDAQDRERR